MDCLVSSALKIRMLLCSGRFDNYGPASTRQLHAHRTLLVSRPNPTTQISGDFRHEAGVGPGNHVKETLQSAKTMMNCLAMAYKIDHLHSVQSIVMMGHHHHHSHYPAHLMHPSRNAKRKSTDRDRRQAPPCNAAGPRTRVPTATLARSLLTAHHGSSSSSSTSGLGGRQRGGRLHIVATSLERRAQ
jgi:hypothetical protein